MKNLKNFAIFAALSATAAFAAPDWASTYHSLLAFDDTGVQDGNRPGYVKPIATDLGSVLNSNWYVSATVPQTFAFEAGMPFALVSLDNDQEYAGGAPTIFGDKKYEWGTMNTDIGSNMKCSGNGPCHVVNGNENLHSLGIFTFPYLQLAGSFYHARLALRGMFLPSISELKAFNLFGFGLQYSFGHLLWPELPPVFEDFDVSLVFGMNFAGIGYTPDDYEGQLDLDISTIDIEMVLGYKPVKLVELLFHIGYESSTMKSSGHLVSHDKDSYGAQINPGITVNGNNGFRLGFEVALSLGEAYHPVVGVDIGTKTTFTTNVLYFKQEFGDDDKVERKDSAEPRKAVIKKSKRNVEDDSEETPLQKKRRKMRQAEVEEVEEQTTEEAVDEEF